MLGGKTFQLVLTRRGKVNPHLAAIFPTPNPLDQPPDSQPIRQADRAMVLDQEVSRQIPDGRAAVLVQSPDRQQHLVLLWLQIFVPGRRFAEVQKTPDLVAERRQGVIVREWEIVGDVRHGSVAFLGIGLCEFKQGGLWVSSRQFSIHSNAESLAHSIYIVTRYY